MIIFTTVVVVTSSAPPRRGPAHCCSLPRPLRLERPREARLEELLAGHHPGDAPGGVHHGDVPQPERPGARKAQERVSAIIDTLVC